MCIPEDVYYLWIAPTILRTSGSVLGILPVGIRPLVEFLYSYAENSITASQKACQYIELHILSMKDI